MNAKAICFWTRQEDGYVQYIDLARVGEEAPMAYVETLSLYSFGFVEPPKEATKISGFSACQ